MVFYWRTRMSFFSGKPSFVGRVFRVMTLVKCIFQKLNFSPQTTVALQALKEWMAQQNELRNEEKLAKI